MPYAAFNNGISIKSVDVGYMAQAGEVLFSSYPTPQQLTSSFTNYTNAAEAVSLQNQILALELTQTPDRVRAAILGTDGGFLSNLNTQIASLQSQLQAAQATIT
jgi:hypothetical protein